MVRLKLAGVPEQVNLPLAICQQEGIFALHGIEVEWVVVPEGTGRMIQLLEDGEVDVALTVTDALMVGVAAGRKARLVGTFVESPLVWAVAASPAHRDAGLTMADLVAQKQEQAGFKFGISRLGSGSHTMAQYASSLHGVANPEFVICNNIAGLAAAAQQGDADAFLWETFTTKPLFDAGELHKAGEVPTPWTAFSVAAGTALSGDADKEAAVRDRLFPALAEGCRRFVADPAAAADRIVATYKHRPEDAAAWLTRVQYNDARVLQLDRTKTADSVAILQQIGLIPADFAVDRLWDGSAVVVAQGP